MSIEGNEQEIPNIVVNQPLDMSNFDPRKVEWTHDIARTKLYPGLANQLDMLYKDIDVGLFGEEAKTGQFYTTIKAVKEAHPKGEIFKPYADLPGPDGTYD